MKMYIKLLRLDKIRKNMKNAVIVNKPGRNAHLILYRSTYVEE